MPPEAAPAAIANGSPEPVAARRTERPLWLRSENDRSFAILHAPAGPASSTAVLIIPPFGWEEESGHRALADWARTLADNGFATLRLELPGTRNSTGGLESRRPATWRDAVGAGAAWLRAQAGAQRVVLLGLGLGGLVAVDAISDGAAIDDLVLWSVPARGRSAIRELRLQARLIAARFPDDDVAVGDDAPFETVGFALARDAVTEFEQLRLGERPIPPAAGRRALLLGRDGMAVDDGLQALLAEAGVTVSVQDGPGWGDLTHDPRSSRYPDMTVDLMIAWLREHAAVAPASDGTAADAETEPAVIEFEHEGTAMRETARWITGVDGDVFAVITEPVQAPADPLCALVLNSGSLSQVGPSRTSVDFARHWAAAFGVTTVRFDLPGLGDSPGDSDYYLRDSAYYDTALVTQTGAVIDRCIELGLPSRFVLAGLCSGAYTALHGALADRRVVGVLLLNLWAVYFSDELLAEREPGDALKRLRHEGVGRLLRRDVTAEKLIGAIRSIRPGRIVAGARHAVEHAQTAEIVAALDRLRENRTETLMLFGIGEPLFDQLEREGLTGRLGAWPNVSLQRIPSRDHLFRTRALQHHVREQIDGAMVRIRDRDRAVTTG